VIINLISLILAGVELAVGYVIGGAVMMITIIGIPFGLQAFKLAARCGRSDGRSSSIRSEAVRSASSAIS